MNLLDKVGEGLAASVDVLVEKNRQMAQLNRLSAIIRTETDMINRAYVALGKQYFKILEGTAEKNDMTQVCEVIKFSEERLKKAQVRYDYVKVYGVPASPVDTVDMIRTNDEEEDAQEENCSECENAENSDAETDEEENSDITIAVAEEEDNSDAAAAAEESSADSEQQPAEAQEEKAEPEEPETEAVSEADEQSEISDEEKTKKTIAEKAAETVSYIKKRRKHRPVKKSFDTETENDG